MNFIMKISASHGFHKFFRAASDFPAAQGVKKQHGKDNIWCFEEGCRWGLGDVSFKGNTHDGLQQQQLHTAVTGCSKSSQDSLLAYGVQFLSQHPFDIFWCILPHGMQSIYSSSSAYVASWLTLLKHFSKPSMRRFIYQHLRFLNSWLQNLSFCSYVVDCCVMRTKSAMSWFNKSSWSLVWTTLPWGPTTAMTHGL